MNITTRGKEYDLLNKFAGDWKTEGTILRTDTTPEIKIFGTDTYEWLPGEYFLLHKVDVVVGDDRNNTFEIIGFDKRLKKYTMQHYDNKGNSGFMTATYLDGLWTFLGERLKFSGGFKNDENEFSGVWEETSEGENWKHLMDIKLARSTQKL